MTKGAGRWAWGVLPALLAAGCEAQAGPAAFDGARALSYVERQLAFGPRIPNTAGHRQMGDWLLAELRQRTDTVIVQAFTQRTSGGETLELRNFFARIAPTATERVLFVAHWDTRPHADKESDSAARRQPVPGANDGASGVAVLLGVADALRSQGGAPRVGVDLLFVDGEDYGDFSDSTQTLLGSRYFAAHQPPGYQPLYAVLFDMVGDKDLRLPTEGNSVAFAPEVVQLVWRKAKALGHGRVFVDESGIGITDDHIPLQQAGIRAIDVIDYDYAHHHTTQDTFDKISAASLKIVGDVALALVR